MLGGALFLVPFGAWEVLTSGGTAGSGAGVTPGVGLAILYSGALAAGIANVFVFNAIRLLGPTRVTVSQFLVPFGAVLLGAWLLQEPVGIAQVAGGAVIVLGRGADPAPDGAAGGGASEGRERLTLAGHSERRASGDLPRRHAPRPSSA